MIISRISGGLGNQMFQYATGRMVASREKVELKLDISGYVDDKFGRHYSLNIFKINTEVASQQEIQKPKSFENRLTRKSPFLYRLLSDSSGTYINEEFRKGIIPEGKNNLYLDGYWQNERYFKKISSLLKKEFELNEPLSGKAKLQYRKITSVNSIGVHIRRGDYVRNARIKQAVGICGIKYYQRAINFMTLRVKDPVLFIFSEDDGLKWAKDVLKIKQRCFLINCRDYEDLSLMKSCKHNIVANSSFSWWGAWLNPNPKKIVIAPSPWFAWYGNPGSEYHSPVPNGWIEFPKN